MAALSSCLNSPIDARHGAGILCANLDLEVGNRPTMKNIDILKKFCSGFPKKLTLGWLAGIGLFSGLWLYAIQANNRIMVMILVAVCIVFGLYVTGRINRK